MSKTVVCNVGDIPENGMKVVDLEDGRSVLVLNNGTEYFACQAVCPHQDVPLCEGFFDGSVLTCHQHLWQWDIRTGAAVGLAELPLERYDIECDDGTLYLASPNAIQVSPLFEEVTPGTRDKLQAIATECQFDAGHVLYDVGDPVDNLYLLESGKVEFLLGRDGRTTPGGFIQHKGEMFGWAALLQNQAVRIARATCMEPSQVWQLSGEEIKRLLADDPESGYVVISKLAELMVRYLEPEAQRGG